MVSVIREQVLQEKVEAIKEASVEGAWVSFHKWSHNVKVDDILQDQESSMVFTAVFPD